MFGSAVHEDLLAKGEHGSPEGEDTGTEVDHILGLVLVMDLQEEILLSLETDLPSDLTCFQDSVGTPISSMLGLAQLARAFPLVWFFMSLLAARKERAPTIFYQCRLKTGVNL